MNDSGPPQPGRIEVVPCAHQGAVDVRCTRYPEDVLHLTAPEWLEFLAAVKAGAFDHLAGPGA
jgi:hypothetical protein